MKTSEFLAHLKDLGIRLSSEGGELRVKAPKGALTAEIRRELGARKDELLALLGAGDPARISASLPPIDVVPRTARMPLSFTQERIWFMDQLEPGITAYNMWVACRLRGALDAPALERAVAEIVRRHEVLRTTFSHADGVPYQRIHERVELSFEHLGNLDGRGPRLTDQELRALLTPRVDTPFDLERGPLLRPALVRVAADEHVLFIAVHHTVFDGVSQGVFFRELKALYEAFAKGEPSPLAELPVQYADYAAWQRRLGADAGFRGQLDYWKELLGGELPVLDLPTDRPRPAVQTHNGATAYLWTTKSTIDALERVGKSKGATLFMVLLAAYKAFLWRYTRQTDLLVGTAMANRNRAEIENLIGFFVNTLVIRTDASGDPTFRELMVRVRDACVGALEHQDMPFQLLVDALQPERSLSHSPLFQTMFVLDEDPGDSRSMGAIELEGVDLGKHFARTDLVLSGYSGRDGFYFWVEYNTDLFEPATIQRMLEHYVRLLEGIVQDPDRRISELPMLSGRELELLTRGWIGPQAEFPHVPLHEQVEAQVERTPEATAVVFPDAGGARSDVALSYRELDRRANRLARHLAAAGARPGGLVGLCLERSGEMVVAQLAILKAGAAYVPLDPGFPAERLAFMARDAGLALVVTTQDLAGLLPSDLALVCLDREAGAIAAQPAERLGVRVGERERMYVIYTSGSTGKPKGVEVEHRSVSNFIASLARAPGFGPGEALLSVTTLSFDISVLETILPLVTGGVLIVAPKEATQDGELLRGLLERLRPAAMQATPATWRMLLLAGWRGDRELRLLCGGEALPRELADELRACGKELWNLYGPTETTIWSTLWRAEPAGPVAIGRPIANTRVYVLGEDRRPVPVGVRGELWIAGEGVARGYLGRPELTAERFVADPFAAGSAGSAQSEGARMYRTGDLGRWRGDGTLECLGRIDTQVKLRGFRIELGEIEAVLEGAEGVRQCAAIVKSDRPGDQRLVAYYVPESAPLDPELLRQRAAAELPAYMVPADFVALEALPLTPNRKVDRRALAALGAAQKPTRSEYAAPRNAGERAITEVFAEVLGLERVGIHDDFFALGGNSLLSTQAVARLRALLGAALPLRDLFEAPTAAGLALRAARALPERTAAITRAPRDAEPPLSYAQQRLWFLDQLEPLSAVYNVWMAWTLRGALDLRAFERAVAEIVRRHEILRTHFGERGGVPHQVIAPPESVRLDYEEAPQGLAREAWRRVVHGRVAELVREPFDLARGPLVRPTLYRVDGGEHVFCLVGHHAVLDGWSLGRFRTELGLLYAAFARGAPSPLAEPALQYADYAVWQREELAGADHAAELAWWERTLAGAPLLELPTDRPRPAVQSYRGANVSRVVPAPLVQALERLGAHEGATAFMVLLAAFEALLARYSGQTDLSIGTALAGRPQRELEELMGYFATTLVLRTDLAGGPGGEPSFRELVRRVRATCLDAYERQATPFEQLVERLAVERDLSYTPLFQAMLILDDSPEAEPRLGELALEPFEVEGKVARTDLTCWARRHRAGLTLAFEYSTDLFDQATVERLLSNFEVLLAAAVAHPDRPVVELPLLTADERKCVLESWNDTCAPIPAAALHEQFERRADESPAAPALIFPSETPGTGGEKLAYAELDARANRLARHLIAAGAAPGALVGLCLERSSAMVVAQLAILKAGAAYVPLDPGFPAERLRFMARDSGLALVVTTSALRGLLEDGGAAGARAVCLDLEARAIDERSSERPGVAVASDQRAYVIYTSGSTGRPKGVEIEHRSVSNFLASMRAEPGFAAGERLLALTTLSFDISVLELLLPLTSGGTLVLAPKEATADGQRLAELIDAYHPDAVQATPATWRMLLLAGWKGHPGTRLFSGGEALPRELADELLSRGSELWNLYGPTETTIWSTCARVAASVASEGASVPIGRPIANTRVYVVDPRGEPQPIGVPGELLIAGAGVARGYLGRHELTAERFVPEPFGPYAGRGERAYRTGDLARWRRDGSLECLGRIDTQVKLRGFRIELGEIEAVLGELEGVAQCAVLLRGDRPENQRLVAYLTPRPGAALPAAEALRDHAARRLPAYMLPAAFVALESLPLTPNGKLDRRALAARAPDEPAAQVEHVAPRNAREKVVADLWREVLGIERVGVRESFFALGGNSLLTTQVAARLRALFTAEVPLRLLFEHPTIEALAPRLGELRGGAPLPGPELRRAPRDGSPLPLSFTQQRLWFLDQLEPGRAVYNVWMAFTLRGPLDRDAFARAVAEIARRHEVLRTRFTEVDGIPAQQIDPPRADVLELLERPAELDDGAWRAALRELFAARLAEPFDLARGPLLRPALAAVAEGEHLFCLTAHHTVLDGWSMGRIQAELAALYAAFAAGRPSPLPEPELQYADYAAWQRELFASAAHEQELAWWTARLAGAARLELPTDHPRPAAQSYAGDTVARELPAELFGRLEALGAELGATPFMVLLAALQALLQRTTGQDDLSVGTVVAGRARRELEGLLGYFANTLVLRTDLSGEPSFRELVRRARETCLSAYDHQDTPFEQLVAELQPSRDLSTTPLFQVLLVLDDSREPDADLGGLRVEPYGIESRVARTDLTLWARRHAGGLSVALEYATDLFERGTIERMLDHLERLIAGAAERPDAPLSELELVGPEQRAELLELGAPAATPFPELPLHAQFEAQVDRTPEATALLLPTALGAGDERLSYRELDRRANRLARHLQKAGVRPGDLVGLCLERSFELVVAQLAILKAGAAYVPLDPLFPPERLGYMVADSKLATAVCTRELAGLLAAPGAPSAGLRTIELDARAEAIAAESDARLELCVDARSRMYVIYTSGSTGRPKGVEIEHRSVSNFMASMAREPGLAPGDTWLAVTTYSFDISVLEIFLPLLTGGTLAIASSEAAADGDQLRALLERVGPQVMQATPATWRMLLLAGWEGDPGLRILCGGEALPRELADELLPRGRELWNLYGPTETTIWSTLARVGPRPAAISIGRPIANTRAYVLDAQRRPVPRGLPGQLWIGGAGLARGYLGRPELTAERFVPDPFAPEDGARMYQTGDLARWRADGELECLGRADDQVKLRGFRIELGEVEAVLAEAPGVRQAVAVVREDVPGDQRLVAYLVLEPPGALDPAALREHARRRLPGYMLPSAFAELEELPLTPNGKVDRRALKAREGVALAGSSHGHVPPATDTERALAAIWGELLGSAEVGRLDNFFDLGGHSLLSVQVTARVRDRLGVRITPRDLMLQNLGQLAAVVEERSALEAAREQERHGPGRRLIDALSGIFKRRDD